MAGTDKYLVAADHQESWSERLVLGVAKSLIISSSFTWTML